jgi:uncharacterized iron-regulated membrane protein
MSLRSFLLWSHRWMGLLSAVVLIVAGVTGALLVLPFADATHTRIATLHVELFAGEVGRWTVIVASGLSLLLQAGGLWLWWPPKPLAVRTNRGWWRLSYDLHQVTGVVSLLMMALLAGTAIGRVFFDYVPVPGFLSLVPRIVGRLHHGDGFPALVLLVYALGSLAFVVQAVTGMLIWWRPSAPLSRRAHPDTPAAPSPG